ncbi:hypothetical protein HZA75_05525 [Candidatus Roizmanbacteria bacterium]|nr:hypothetical protein [Candidatus Roizmanbacteria bacterium]
MAEHNPIKHVLTDPATRTDAVAGAADVMRDTWRAAGVHSDDIEKYTGKNGKVFDPNRTRRQHSALIETANELVSGNPNKMADRRARTTYGRAVQIGLGRRIV